MSTAERKQNASKRPDLSVEIAGVKLKNPVMTASGTFGSGIEYSEFVDLNNLGAVVTKGVANVPWEGNPTPRVAEVYGGMLNAIGLQNPGIDVFIERDLAFLKGFDTKVIVNVCGHTEEEYLEVVERLADQPVILLHISDVRYIYLIRVYPFYSFEKGSVKFIPVLFFKHDRRKIQEDSFFYTYLPVARSCFFPCLFNRTFFKQREVSLQIMYIG